MRFSEREDWRNFIGPKYELIIITSYGKPEIIVSKGGDSLAVEEQGLLRGCEPHRHQARGGSDRGEGSRSQRWMLRQKQSEDRSHHRLLSAGSCCNWDRSVADLEKGN